MNLIPDQNPLPARPATPPWGVVASIAWVVLAFIAGMIMAAAAYALLKGGRTESARTSYDGVAIALGILASVPVQVAVLAYAAQWRRWRVSDYLGLAWPRRADVVVAALSVIAMTVVFDGIQLLSGRDLVPAFQIEAYQSAKAGGALLAFTLALVLVAPVGEEIAFRGFLHRGFAQGGRDGLAIVAIALAWALLHIQYDWLGMAQVFTAGLVLGWFRWVSGSTALTIVMHMAINLEAMLETAIKMELLS